MRRKQLLISFATILTLSSNLWANFVFATGAEESSTPGQGQETGPTTERPDDPGDVSSNAPIGGGANADNEQEPAPDTPNQPETPPITNPIPQPEDGDTVPSTPDVKPTAPNPVTPSTQTPQTNASSATSLSTQDSTNNFVKDNHSETTAPATAPTNNQLEFEEDTIDIPQTGLIEPLQSTFNPLAFVMLILAGIAIAAAGVVVILLGKAARHEQEIL